VASSSATSALVTPETTHLSSSSSPPPSYLAAQLAKPWAETLRQEVGNLRAAAAVAASTETNVNAPPPPPAATLLPAPPLAIDELEPVSFEGPRPLPPRNTLVSPPEALVPSSRAVEYQADNPPSDLWGDAPPLEEGFLSCDVGPPETESPQTTEFMEEVPPSEVSGASSVTAPVATVAPTVVLEETFIPAAAAALASGFQRWRVKGEASPVEQTNWSEVHEWLKKFLHARRLDTPELADEAEITSDSGRSSAEPEAFETDSDETA
jgi:hypothetical protein